MWETKKERKRLVVGVNFPKIFIIIYDTRESQFVVFRIQRIDIISCWWHGRYWNKREREKTCTKSQRIKMRRQNFKLKQKNKRLCKGLSVITKYFSYNEIVGFHVVLNRVWKGIDRYSCGRSSSTLCWHKTWLFFFSKNTFKRVVWISLSITRWPKSASLKKEEQMD